MKRRAAAIPLRPIRTASRRRAAVGVAAVIALVFLQLLIVGAIITGTRDQDMSVQRANAARAFYAAEGGMNMSIREFMAGGGAGADYDGDLTVGSISDDGNATDNPTVGSARVSVTRTAITNQSYQVASNATSGSCRSKLLATLAIDSVAGRRVIYGQWSNTFPQYRVWTGAQWGAPMNTMDFGSKIYWAAMRRSPIQTEVTAVCSLQSGDLRAAVQKGFTWGNLVSLTNDCGTTTSRPFSFGYEQVSGRGLVVYRRQNQSKTFYRIWDGTTWSSENSVNTALSGRPIFMKLVPRANSNEMMYYAIDDQQMIIAMLWNGSAFVNQVTLETSCVHVASNVDNEDVDAAYEAGTGRCMLVWGRNSVMQPQYRIWDGTAWQAQGAMPALSDLAAWPHLSTDRASNRIMCGILDMSGHITVNIWNGSSWGSNLQVESLASTLGSRCFDVCFEPAGTRALVMWGRDILSQPRYRTYDGSSWSSEMIGPAFLSQTYLVQMMPSRKGSEIMILNNVKGGQNALEFVRWDGSNLVNYQTLEANLSGPVGAEVFMIPDDPQGVIDPMRVWTWAPSPP